jgi:hypothetical protein
MATLSEMASNIAKQATSIGMEAATLALRLADAECKVTDRMQGVDCPLCEDATLHTHGTPAPKYDHECGRTCAGDGCVCPCHNTQSAPANFASVGSPFTSESDRTPAPAPVDGALVESACTAFMTVPWTPKQPQHLREPIAAVVRLVQQDSNVRFKKALMVSNGFMLTNGEISDILARIAAPPTLQERITERFKTQRCINSSVWNPEELAKIAVEEAKKEVK